MNLDLSLAGFRSTPFPYALFDSVFKNTTSVFLLAWLEDAALWELSRTEFYEQYEFSLDDAPLPSLAQFLVQPAFKDTLRSHFQQIFNVSLSPRVDVLAHKLVPGQRIGIHNDMRCGGESLRFTVQLNRNLAESDGGYFMLFNSQDVRDVHRILKPVNNTALAFAICEKSHHAVSIQRRGIRFTLVFSFYCC